MNRVMFNIGRYFVIMCLISVFALPAMADDVVQKDGTIASVEYVEREMQPLLNDGTALERAKTVVVTDTSTNDGNVISNVTATGDGTITFTKTKVATGTDVTNAINALDSTSSGTGAVVTDVSQTDGKVTVTKGNVKIPVGGQNATTYAAVWIE